jgi:hypothetical protein
VTWVSSRPAVRQSRDAPRRRRSGRGWRSAGAALWHERGCGVDADGVARRRLPITSPVPAQQAPRSCRCPDEAAASASRATLLLQASRSGAFPRDRSQRLVWSLARPGTTGRVREQQPAAGPATSKWWLLPWQTGSIRSIDGAPPVLGEQPAAPVEGGLFQLALCGYEIRAVAAAPQAGNAGASATFFAHSTRPTSRSSACSSSCSRRSRGIFEASHLLPRFTKASLAARLVAAGCMA